FVVCVWAARGDTPVVRASGRELSFVLLLGIVMCYLVTFALVFRPTDVLCSLQRFGTGFCFTVVYAALLTKTNRIARIFAASKHSARRPSLISPKSQLLICTVLVSIQVVIVVVWQIVSPARAIHHYPTREDNMLVCDSYVDASYTIAFFYPIVLIVVCTVYAVLTRKIPEAFNESKHIGFTMYTTCVIWLAFVPLYFGTASHVPLRVTSMAVTISLSASVTLVCLFSPKLYIILVRPERNVRGTLRAGGSRGWRAAAAGGAVCAALVGTAPLPRHDPTPSTDRSTLFDNEKVLSDKCSQTDDLKPEAARPTNGKAHIPAEALALDAGKLPPAGLPTFERKPRRLLNGPPGIILTYLFCEMFANTLSSWSRAEHPSLGYILTYFTRLSLWIPTRSHTHSLLHKALFAFVIAMFLNQVLYVALKQDMQAVLVFLQLLVYNIGVVKMLSYIVFYRQWNTVVTSVSEMELTFCLDSNCRVAVRKYSAHNRKLVAFVLLLTVVICVYTAPNRVYNQVKHLIRGEELSLERRFFYFCWPEPVAGLSGFLYILVEEMVCFSNVMYSVAWDILTTSCMATVAGLLDVVAVEFRQTLDEGTDEEKIKRLIKCYQLYQRIIETYKVSHRVVDPVLFMYLLMTSVNISITIISIKNTVSRGSSSGTLL
ncbi:hypothetical protein JYU34_006205, partial [Plutella xylostella]